MKFKGSLISQLSGKLGGLVASTAKGGLQYLRRRPSLAKAPSDLQVLIRAAMATLSQRWSQVLSQGQRDGWETYAQNVARLDNQGNTIHISGFAWYVGNNLPRVNRNGVFPALTELTITDSAPDSFDLGNPPAFAPGKAAVAVLGSNFTVSIDSDVVPIGGVTATTGQNSVLVYASTPFSAGRADPVGPNNLVGSFTGTSGTLSGTLPANLVTSGTSPKQNFTLRLSRQDGRLSSPFQLVAP